MPDTTVKYYDSSMSGAPSLSGTAGALIGVLDGCLVDGFGSVTVNSLVVAANVATVTVSGGHQFAAIGNTGPVITIAGASPSGLNGQWRVTVTSTTVFTFTTSGISDQTATGTITAKRSPAGFSKAFSATNKAVYRADQVASTRLYLRVDDTNAQWGYLRGYETMSDVDTGTRLFPATGEVYAAKSSTASSTARDWVLVADDRAFYLFEKSDGSYWPGTVFFGDINSWVAGDAYRCALCGHALTNALSSTYFVTLSSADQDGQYLARNYTQLGSSLKFGKLSNGRMTYLGNNSALTYYPNRPANQFIAAPVDIWENGGIDYRGQFPGLYNPISHYTGLAHGTVITSATGLSSSRDLWVQALHSNNQYRAAIDITGPWR